MLKILVRYCMIIYMRIFKKTINGKKSKKWWIDYTVNGVRIRKPVSTSKKEAEKALNKIQSDIIHKKYSLPKDERIKFSTFAKKYIKEHSIPTKTKRSYKTDITLLKNLIVFFGDLYLNEITDYHYEQYRNIRLKQKVKNRNRMTSPTTINREGALLRSILNKAVQWDFLNYNPIKKMSMYKEMPKERILTEQEMNIIVSNAEGHLKQIILIALNTGMRRGEILNLRWNHVNLSERYLTIPAMNTKAKESRDIALNNTMVELFSKSRLRRNRDEYVFVNPVTGKPFTDIKTSWNTLIKRIGITDLRFHDLRHCFATYRVLKGGDLVSLKETLGHAKLATTERYTKALMEGKRKLVDCFEVTDSDSNIIDSQVSKQD